jgi:glutathione S-transferase
VTKETKDAVVNVLKILEGYLSGSDYFAGNDLTIADFSILANVTSIVVSTILL